MSATYSEQSEAPPILLRHVRLGAGGPLGDLRISAGVVTSAGPRVDRLAGDEIVDGTGATVLPGLWDCHVHTVQWALARQRLDLSAASSAQAAVDLAAARPRRTGGEVLIGYGFRDAAWPDTPHKKLLEAATPGRAVVLVSNDLHTAWFSPAALRLVGAGDHPDGVLKERDCYRAMAALPPPPQAELDRWIAESTTAAAARGVVGLLDFEYADNVADWSRRVAAHQVDTRVVCSIPADRLGRATAAGLRTGAPVPGSGGLLEVGPVKMFVDGSLNTRTAYCADPYPGLAGGEDAHGRLETPPELLRDLMTEAARHGLKPAVHAIGDLAVGLALDAFEAVGCSGRIEHAQLVRREDLSRFARSRLVAGVQPAHAPDDRDVADRVWPGRTDRAFPYADLLRAGAVLELGSDAPVAPLDPWDGIASAVARTDDDRPAWHPEQSISVADALAATNRGRRTVRVGDPADLVLVEHDPTTLTPVELRTVTVVATLLAGRFTHRAG
jgi:predicted amidohydrolase YtcJ